MCHMSRVRCHMSLYYLSKTVRARDLKFSHNMSCVICHVLSVVCKRYFFYKVAELVGWGSVINRAYPCYFFYIFFLLKTLWYLIFTRLVVVCFGSLRKANWWEINFRVIGLIFKCQKWQTSAAAESAPCAHFQKLDVGIKKKILNLGLGIFPPVLRSLFHG